MNETTLRAACAHGKTYRRKLSPCHDLIWVPDMEFAVVLMNPAPKPIFDFSKCRRMSKGMARRCINLMAEPEPLKQFYRDLLDGRPCGKEM